MKENRLVLLAYLAVCFFWGSTYLAIKIGVESIPPLIFAGIRFLIAGMIMVLYAYKKGFTFPKTFRTFYPIAIVGALMLAGGNGLVTIAEVKVASGIASLFVAMVPLYIATIESIMVKNVRLSKIGYLGLIIGFIGVYLLVNPSGSNSLISLDGVILLLLAGLLWSFGSVYSKYISKEVHIISSIGLQMLSGGVLLLIIGLISGESLAGGFELRSIYALIYLIIFGSIISYSSYIYVLSKWPAAKAGTYAYVNPVVALLLGYLILGEPLNITMVISMSIILFSVFLVQKSKVKDIELSN